MRAVLVLALCGAAMAQSSDTLSTVVLSVADSTASAGEAAAVSTLTSYALASQASQIDGLVQLNHELFQPYEHHVETITKLANDFYEISCESLKLLELERADALDLQQRLGLMREAFKRGDDRAVIRQLGGLKKRLRATRDKVTSLRTKHSTVRKGAEAEEALLEQDLVKVAESGIVQSRAEKHKKVAGRALLATSVVIIGPAAAVGTQLAVQGLVAAGAGAAAAGGAGVHQLIQARKHQQYALGFEELGSNVLEFLRYNLNATVGYLRGLEAKYDKAILALETGESGVGLAKDTLAQDPPPDFSEGEVDSLFDHLVEVTSGVHGSADEFITAFTEGALPESVKHVLPMPPGLSVNPDDEPRASSEL